jgi:hypothetical protein
MQKIGEKFSEDHEIGDEQFERWEKWCEENVVEHSGICEHWEPSKDKARVAKEKPTGVFQAMGIEEDRCPREWITLGLNRVVRCPNMVPRTGDLFCERCKEVHTKWISLMEKRNREE